LLIRESKFGKTRLVPFQNGAREAMGSYAKLRGAVHPQRQTNAFLVTVTGKGLFYTVVGGTFRDLCAKAAWESARHTALSSTT
jgi:site-specific recombinase XerD